MDKWSYRRRDGESLPAGPPCDRAVAAQWVSIRRLSRRLDGAFCDPDPAPALHDL